MALFNRLCIESGFDTTIYGSINQNPYLKKSPMAALFIERHLEMSENVFVHPEKSESNSNTT